MNEHDDGARVKAFCLPRVMIERLVRTGGTLHCVQGVPHGARIVGVEYDVQRDGFIVGAEHPSFAPVAPNEYPPVETVRLETVGDVRLVGARGLP